MKLYCGKRIVFLAYSIHGCSQECEARCGWAKNEKEKYQCEECLKDNHQAK